MHNHEDELHEHKATWLELFYDLVFVVAISTLTHRLSEHISWQGVLSFGFLFIPVWWSWIGVTFYNDRFETGDLSQRFYTFLHMTAIGALAYHLHGGMEEQSTGFALSYIFTRSIIIWLWARAGIYNPLIRKVTDRYLIGFLLSISLWIASLWVEMPTRFILWGIALFIELLTPLTTLKIQERLQTMKASPHLPERFGLFIIIVLGESIVAITKGLAETHHMTINTFFTALLGATFTFMIWWLYFDFINPRPIRKGAGFLASWAYGHFPLVISIAALGAGILNLIKMNGDILPINVVWLVCGSLSVALISIGILENSLATYKNRLCSTPVGKAVRYGGALVCLTLPIFPILHIAWRLLGILILIVISQIIHSENSTCHIHSENVLNDLET